MSNETVFLLSACQGHTDTNLLAGLHKPRPLARSVSTLIYCYNRLRVHADTKLNAYGAAQLKTRGCQTQKTSANKSGGRLEDEYLFLEYILKWSKVELCIYKSYLALYVQRCSTPAERLQMVSSRKA